MPRVFNQKQRMFALYRLLYEQTDENNALTMKQILNKLVDMGFPAETDRRSIYSDIEILNEQFAENPRNKYKFKIIIERTNTNPIRYYLKNREFELSELKLLLDSVKTFKYITKAQTNTLIKKIETLCNKHQLKELREREYEVDFQKVRPVTNNVIEYTKRTEHNNNPIKIDWAKYQGKKARRLTKKDKLAFLINSNAELFQYKKIISGDIFLKIDVIHEAIRNNKCILLKYSQYIASTISEDEIVKLRRSSRKQNLISPFALVYTNGAYYVIGVTYSEKDEEQKLVRYQIEKMNYIEVRSIERQGHKLFAQFKKENGADYIRRFFSIAEGKSQRIQIEFESSLMDDIIERFGGDTDDTKRIQRDLHITKIGKDRYRINPLVVVNNQFYGWLFSLGNGAKVTAPSSLVIDIKYHLKDIRKLY